MNGSVLREAPAGASAFWHLNDLLEKEAERIAHALHDEAGQLLTVVYLKLAEAAREAPARCRRHFEDIKGTLDQIELQLRRLSHELHPAVLDDFGLAAAIEFLVKGVSERTQLDIRLETTVHGRHPRTLEIALYRAVQEALTNVSRHAKATRVTVSLHREGRSLVCKIRDNGRGFDTTAVKQGLGLLGMRQRVEALGGRLVVASKPGRGAEVAIGVPLNVAHMQAAQTAVGY